jgi:hypothetical protein
VSIPEILGTERGIDEVVYFASPIAAIAGTGRKIKKRLAPRFEDQPGWMETKESDVRLLNTKRNGSVVGYMSQWFRSFCLLAWDTFVTHGRGIKGCQLAAQMKTRREGQWS